MTVFEAIDNRSSARSYTNEALTAEEARCIVEAGLKAPTSGNRQELFFSVLKGDHPLLREIEAEKTDSAAARPRRTSITTRRWSSSFLASRTTPGAAWTPASPWRIWPWRPKVSALAT